MRQQYRHRAAAQITHANILVLYVGCDACYPLTMPMEASLRELLFETRSRSQTASL
jgi:hypothetical protein